MLYMIGTGLSDPDDISVKGLEAVRTCDYIYLESYTSKLQCSVEELEKFYGRDIIEAGRELVEQSGDILKNAKDREVAFIVMGDVFSATTHFQLYREALEMGIEVNVVHNASILNAVGITGLQLYKFGRTASIPFHNEKVTVPKEIMEGNQKMGLHTLFLLDLNPEKGKYLTIKDAIEYLGHEGLCIGCARLGSKDFVVKAGNSQEVAQADFGEPPYCLIVPGNMHFTEEEALSLWQ